MNEAQLCKLLYTLWVEATDLPDEQSPLFLALVTECLEGSEDLSGNERLEHMAELMSVVAEDCNKFASEIERHVRGGD